jgi:hypothetical protein
MSRHARPGGLTALAVANFVLSGLSLLGIFNALALIGIMTLGKDQPEFKKAIDQNPEVKELLASIPGLWFPLVLAGIRLVACVLYILAGIGLLGLKRFLGRGLSNLLAVFLLGAFAFEVALWPAGFSLLALFDVIYALLLLFLVNTTFREDFAR